MWNVAGIFVQGYMPMMLNACIQVLLVTLLIVLSAYEAHIQTSLSHIST